MTKDHRGIKRICIYGVDGIGGYFGGKMADAINRGENQYYEVFFVTQGEHLRKIQENGLVLKSLAQDPMICKPSRAVENFAELPPVDLILISGKRNDLERVIGEIPTNVLPETVIISLIDGVDVYCQIRNLLPSGLVLPGCAAVSGFIDEPGKVVHTGGEMFIFGKDPKYSEVTPEAVFQVFNDLKIKYQWNDDPSPAIWENFIHKATFGLITAYSGKTVAEVLADQQLKVYAQKMVSEMVSVASQEGIKLTDNFVFEYLEKEAEFPSRQKALESKRNVTREDLFGSTILRLGKKYRIPTPITEIINYYLQNTLNPPCPDYF